MGGGVGLLEAEFGALTQISEANFGAKPPTTYYGSIGAPSLCVILEPRQYV